MHTCPSRIYIVSKMLHKCFVGFGVYRARVALKLANQVSCAVKVTDDTFLGTREKASITRK
jgi:hypothetical protein